ncbi:MAG: glycoside-pentoside-hexuronide (GPH):cation symporter [Lachnospiraceae bacterium]|nr:glycoside-pentoside-hexuronide (GPH):cation symporter [Lachnospiraceae bacterium]
MTDNSTPINDSANVKLSTRKIIDYSLCAGAYQLVMYWINTYMSLYYTDVIGVSVTTVASLLMAVQIFDAINDPIIGTIADRSNFKKGKYTPWVFYGAIGLSVFTFLLFSASPAWDRGMKVIWMTVMYLFVTVCQTCFYMPYIALNGVMTSNSEIRNRISAFRTVFENIGGQGVGMIAIPMILLFASATSGPEAARGYTISLAICALLFILVAFYTSKRTDEHVLHSAAAQTTVPLKTQLSYFFRNRYALCLAFGFLMLGIMVYGRMSVLSYYFTYNRGDVSMMGLFSMISLVSVLVGSGFFAIWIYRIFRDKAKALIFACALNFAVSCVMYLSSSTAVFWVCMFLSQTCISVLGGTFYGMIGDVCDYGEYRFHIRSDGVVSAFLSMLMKGGGAVTPTIILLVMDKQGYVPNSVQNEAVLNTINFGISMIGGIAALILVIIFAFYKLNEENLKLYREVVLKRALEEELHI